MSDPSNQRAVGCSIFFTLILLVLLLSGFYFAQHFFEPSSPVSVTYAVDSVRKEKAEAHRKQNDLFITAVDQFHAERNSSLETSMNEVLQDYRSSLRVNQSQSK